MLVVDNIFCSWTITKQRDWTRLDEIMMIAYEDGQVWIDNDNNLLVVSTNYFDIPDIMLNFVELLGH